MACEACKDIVETTNLNSPYVIRTCKKCGGKMNVHSRGKHGIGIHTEEGDQVVIPKEWLTVHANPLKGRGHLTKAGLEWFAKMIFLSDFPQTMEQIDHAIAENEAYTVKILQDSELLAGLDIEKEEDAV